MVLAYGMSLSPAISHYNVAGQHFPAANDDDVSNSAGRKLSQMPTDLSIKSAIPHRQSGLTKRPNKPVCVSVSQWFHCTPYTDICGGTYCPL